MRALASFTKLLMLTFAYTIFFPAGKPLTVMHHYVSYIHGNFCKSMCIFEHMHKKGENMKYIVYGIKCNDETWRKQENLKSLFVENVIWRNVTTFLYKKLKGKRKRMKPKMSTFYWKWLNFSIELKCPPLVLSQQQRSTDSAKSSTLTIFTIWES